MEDLKKNKKVIIVILVLLFVVGIGSYWYFKSINNEGMDIDKLSIGTSDNKLDNIKEDNNQKSGLEIEQSEVDNEEEIYVHIIGEVKNEGIVILTKGQRITDAIEKAGGVTELADVSKVNLAFVLSDGQKVRIPSIHDSDENCSCVIDNSGDNVVVADGGGGSKARNMVNINTATQTELETLNGIGPSLAAKIIDYRNKNGKFKSVDDLRNVSGIGEAKFKGIRDCVVVK